ncbi:MAG TPA: IclR family transcriptional regulator [Candidatus Limnocylindrales bacterium]
MSRVQSIERAFAVLEALTNGPIGVTEVAERVSLPKSTAARMLASLAREAMVEQLPGETRWRLGPRVGALAAAVRSPRSLVEIARAALVALAATTDEAAGLSVPDGDAVHYIDQVDTRHAVAVRDWTGTRLPLHPVSSGLVFLAHRRPAEIDRYLAGELERFTPRTVVDPATIRDRLHRIRLDGYAWTRDEYADGISSVAAPVVDPDGVIVAAVHVHGPSYRFPAEDPAVVTREVVAAAGRLTARLRAIARS